MVKSDVVKCDCNSPDECVHVCAGKRVIVRLCIESDRAASCHCMSIKMEVDDSSDLLLLLSFFVGIKIIADKDVSLSPRFEGL